jgi:hypothetical protein
MSCPVMRTFQEAVEKGKGFLLLQKPVFLCGTYVKIVVHKLAVRLQALSI